MNFFEIYIIISFEIFGIESKFELKITFKVINDSMNSHELIFIYVKICVSSISREFIWLEFMGLNGRHSHKANRRADSDEC